MSVNFLSELTGSFASPAAENPTVAMVEAAYRHHGLDWRYLNCHVRPDDLGSAVAGARAMNWAGFNCSIPHKVEVMKYLDAIGESAEIIGAVNCVVRRASEYIGENTDGKGFLLSLREMVDPAQASVVVLGAGGAARACAVELALSQARTITIVNRDVPRGLSLVETLNSRTGAKAVFHHWDGIYRVPAGVDIVVNATSIGLYPGVDELPSLDLNSLSEKQIVTDIIPNPPNTRLLAEAARRGCRTLNGLGMLVNQGVIGIKYWTGVDVDRAVMLACLANIFNKGDII